MQVTVLGTFQVRRHGRLLVPSAPKLRQVLALLAINANTVVSTDQIIEELWEERPPSSATTTLQTYIYHLRKLYDLGFGTREPADSPGTEPALYRSPNGYVLQLADDAVDSAHFLRLAEQAKEQMEDGSLEPAADSMRAALQLWRGPALVDVTAGPLLRAMTVWLEERRRGLTLQRIDADLHLRRHHEVIGELTGLVAQRPTDESLQSRLMLALYRAGRRSDALQVYQQARSALAEELGLEPLPELQRVHQAVLVADPAMEPPGLVQAMTSAGTEGRHHAPASHRPDQLPPDVVRLVGREEELTALSGAMVRRNRGCAAVAVVDGPPGSGKSALCVHFAHRVRQDYPDGQLYARLIDDADGPVDPARVLAGFLRAAGYPDDRLPASVPELSSMFRSWSAGRKVLVVLDDAVSFEQVQPLLPTGPDCGTLVAARRRFSHPVVATTVHLGALSRGDALELLTHILSEQRVSTQLPAVEELVELCEGLPSALRESATELELKPHWPISRYVDRIRGTAAPEPRGAGGAGGVGTTRSVERTYRLLSTDLQTAFRALLDAERPLSLSAAASLLRVDADQAEALVEELVQFGLVEVEYMADLDGFQYRVRRPFREFPSGARPAGYDSPADSNPPRAA